MSINSIQSAGGNEVVISVEGRFDFSSHQAFRDSYSDTDGSGVTYVIDMARAEYMDSSALGMLLQLREHAGGNNLKVCIRNCNPEIAEILRISNFNKLFTLE